MYHGKLLPFIGDKSRFSVVHCQSKDLLSFSGRRILIFALSLSRILVFSLSYSRILAFAL